VADPTLKIHSKPPLLAPATGLHLDLIHGGVEALYIPPLLGGKEACRLRLAMMLDRSNSSRQDGYGRDWGTVEERRWFC
jgi:hypothetical protein